MESRASPAYELDLAIAPDATHVHGEWRMRVTLVDAAQDLVLDWHGGPATGLTVNGVRVAAQAYASRLVAPVYALRPGENVLAMPVASPIAPGGTPVLRHDDPDDGAAYVYSLFVPADASALFPCVDHPDAKARFRLSLSVPDDWTAVSCAPALAATSGRFEFDWTPPLPTYAFAFAAGPFAVVDAPPGAMRARAFLRRSQAEHIRHDALEALRLSRKAVDWGERFFGMPFPFAKHDLVAVPAFPFSGMEHAGATFLDEAAIAIGPHATEGARRRRAHLVFHETVHQWLGDCVTMRTFGDLWLKEGFANLGAGLAAEDADPTLHPQLALHRLKAAAVRQDLAAGAVTVRRPVAHSRDAKSLYGPAVYGKAPALLRQARQLVGEKAFAEAVRTLVRDHAYAAADGDDLGDALASASGLPMREWLSAWLDGVGAPTVRLQIDAREGRIESARVTRVGARAGQWPVQRLEAVACFADGTERRTCYVLDSDAAELQAWRGLPVPRIAFANAGDSGYGRFLLDDATREAALCGLASVTDPLLRLQLVEALWDHVRDADLDPARFLDFAVSEIAREGEWGVAAALVEHAEIAATRYVGDPQRSAARPTLDAARRTLGLARPMPGDPACLALVARAQIANAAEKASSFHAFLHDASLPERWIEAAAERFNAVEHAPLTRPFLRPALDALPALARERRIFFVDRWLAAFMGGQVDKEALAEVTRFLAESALDVDLRRKVLAHADELARTVRIRARYAPAE